MKIKKISVKKVRIIVFALVGLAVVMNTLLQVSWSKQLVYSDALVIILLAYILIVIGVFAYLMFKIKKNYEK